MIEGFINEYEDLVVPLTLILTDEHLIVNSIIDTGFNGYLSVSRYLIEESNWIYMGHEEYELANREIIEEEIYLGEIIFDERIYNVIVVATNSDEVLIGTRLLRDKILTVNFCSSRVEIVDCWVRLIEGEIRIKKDSEIASKIFSAYDGSIKVKVSESK